MIQEKRIPRAEMGHLFEWTDDLLAYDLRLCRFDWNYNYADDYGIWSRGHAEWNAICNLAKHNASCEAILEWHVKNR